MYQSILAGCFMFLLVQLQLGYEKLNQSGFVCDYIGKYKKCQNMTRKAKVGYIYDTNH
jgi:hypothetical protein